LALQTAVKGDTSLASASTLCRWEYARTKIRSQEHKAWIFPRIIDDGCALPAKHRQATLSVAAAASRVGIALPQNA